MFSETFSEEHKRNYKFYTIILKSMSIFNEANMIASIEKYLPHGQNLKAGIHAIVKKVVLQRFFSNAVYDSSDNLLKPECGAPLFYISKSKVATFDVYIGFSEDYLVIVPCEKESWHYKHTEVTNPEFLAVCTQLAMEVQSPFCLADILPVYRISQIEKCEIEKNWVGAYVCKIEFDTGDFIKILLPPFAGLFGGMPHHKVYRNAILELLKAKI